MAGKTYDVLLRVIAEDLASPVLQGIGGALSNMATIAGGIALARMFEGAANAAADFAGAGLQAAGAMQAQQAGISSLMAYEARRASIVTQDIVTGYRRVELTKKEGDEIESLNKKLQRYSTSGPYAAARANVAFQRTWEQLNRWQTADALAVVEGQAHYADMQNQMAMTADEMAQVSARVAELTAKQGQMVPITKRVIVSEMSFSDAMLKVSKDALEQYEGLRRLGFKRGVPTEDITSMFQFGLGVGFSTDEMNKLLPAITDWSTATGKTPQVLQRVVKAMGDVKSAGRLMAQELLQFKNANVPMLQLLSDKLGMTTSAVQDLIKGGGISDTQVFDVLIDWANEFNPAADEMSKTLPVLERSFKAIATAGVAEFFLGSAEAIGRFLAPYRDLFTLSGDPFANLRASGDSLGSWLEGVLNDLKPTADKIFALFTGQGGGNNLPPGIRNTQPTIQGILGVDPVELQALSSNLASLWGNIAISATTASTGLQGFIAQLPPLGNILPTINANWGPLSLGIETFVGILAARGVAALILGLVSALAALAASPFVVIVTSVALLASAWNNDFAGMRTAVGLLVTQLATDIPRIKKLLDDLGLSLPGVTSGPANAEFEKEEAAKRAQALSRNPGDTTFARFYDFSKKVTLPADIINDMISEYVWKPIADSVSTFFTSLWSSLVTAFSGFMATWSTHTSDFITSTNNINTGTLNANAALVGLGMSIGDLVSDLNAYIASIRGMTPTSPLPAMPGATGTPIPSTNLNFTVNNTVGAPKEVEDATTRAILKALGRVQEAVGAY